MQENQPLNSNPNSQQKLPPIPPKKSKGGCLKYGLIILGIFVLIGVIANIGGNSTSSNSASTDTLSADSTTSSESSNSATTEKKDEKTWDYDTRVDEMNDSKSKFASLTSDNSVEFDFPYQGGSDLTITVRSTKKWGTDVYISISKGQFICNEYEGTDYVRVRFDDGKPMKFTTNEPSDGSSDMLFLNNSKKFISLAKKAKRILVEAPFYQAGNQVFTFTVDKPLNW